MPGIAHMFTQGLTELATAGAREPVGTIRREASKTYKYVKFVKGAGSVAVLAGHVVGYVNLAGYNANEATADTSPVTVSGAGIALVAATVAQMDAANGAHGWIQIAGISGILAVDIGGTPTIGQSAIAGAADGSLDMMVATGTNDPVLGVIIDTTAAAMKVVCQFPQ